MAYAEVNVHYLVLSEIPRDVLNIHAFFNRFDCRITTIGLMWDLVFDTETGFVLFCMLYGEYINNGRVTIKYLSAE